MFTGLVTLSYLDGLDRQNNNRLERNIRYLNYYIPLKDKLGFDRIVFIDNDSSQESINEIRKVGNGILDIIRLSPHLPSGSALNYPYCWRGLYELKTLINRGYDKIISIDSDGFVLSQRLANYFRLLDTGWTSLWCPRWNFPESACHVLCEDSFPIYLDYIEQMPWQNRVGTKMETSLPFTYINKAFNADRYGESRLPQCTEMDYYGQANLKTDLKCYEG